MWFGNTVVNMDELVKSNTIVLILAFLYKEEIDCFCKEQENIKVLSLRGVNRMEAI